MDFKDRLQKTLNQGLSASKDLFGKAKDKAKDLSDIGVLKYEIGQLKKQEEQRLEQLGKTVYTMLVLEEHSTVSKKTPSIKKHIDDIDDIGRRIKGKEELLKKYEKNNPKP